MIMLPGAVNMLGVCGPLRHSEIRNYILFYVQATFKNIFFFFSRPLAGLRLPTIQPIKLVVFSFDC